MAEGIRDIDEPVVWGSGNWFHGGGYEEFLQHCTTGARFACRSALLDENDVKRKTQRATNDDDA